MPSSVKTPNFGFNQWQPNDKPSFDDFNADNLIIDAAIGGKTNILHNWYFKNPVNQRSVSGTISTLGYFIDRWRLISGTVTLTSNGLTLNGTIIQPLEYAVGENVFASVMMYSGTATASYDNSTKAFTITSSGGTIESAKLEDGTASTLAADPPQDYGMELAKCQRYQLRTGGNWIYVRASNVAASSVSFSLSTPATLRVNPTISSGSLEIRTVDGTPQTGFTFSLFYTGNGLFINAIKTAHGLSDSTLVVKDIVFDANL